MSGPSAKEIIERWRALERQLASPGLDDESRASLQMQVDKLRAEYQRIAGRELGDEPQPAPESTDEESPPG